MTNDMAEVGIISKEIGWIFLGNQKDQWWRCGTRLGPKHKTANSSSLGKESRWEAPIKRYTLNMGVEEVSDPWEEVALDAISRGFRESGRMPDCIKNTNRSLKKETGLRVSLRLASCCFWHSWEWTHTCSRLCGMTCCLPEREGKLF